MLPPDVVPLTVLDVDSAVELVSVLDANSGGSAGTAPARPGLMVLAAPSI